MRWKRRKAKGNNKNVLIKHAYFLSIKQFNYEKDHDVLSAARITCNGFLPKDK